jgi:hypothetical protein
MEDVSDWKHLIGKENITERTSRSSQHYYKRTLGLELFLWKTRFKLHWISTWFQNLVESILEIYHDFNCKQVNRWSSNKFNGVIMNSGAWWNDLRPQWRASLIEDAPTCNLSEAQRKPFRSRTRRYMHEPASKDASSFSFTSKLQMMQAASVWVVVHGILGPYVRIVHSHLAFSCWRGLQKTWEVCTCVWHVWIKCIIYIHTHIHTCTHFIYIYTHFSITILHPCTPNTRSNQLVIMSATLQGLCLLFWKNVSPGLTRHALTQFWFFSYFGYSYFQLTREPKVTS